MDAVKGDMAVVEVTEEDAEDRTEWRWKIRCGNPSREQPNEEEDDLVSKINLSVGLPYLLANLKYWQYKDVCMRDSGVARGATGAMAPPPNFW